MPNGLGSFGLNFDDINECGIQCREEVVKTYKEPQSLMAGGLRPLEALFHLRYLSKQQLRW